MLCHNLAVWVCLSIVFGKLISEKTAASIGGFWQANNSFMQLLVLRGLPNLILKL